MKANKALKRLTNIETLIADLAARYSPTAPRMREVLQDAKAAVARAKEALSLLAAKAVRGAKKAAPARKKAAEKKAAAKATTAKSAKKRARIKKAAKKRAETTAASAAVNAAPETAGTGASIGEAE
jgi:hypothetical protein